VSSRHWPVKAIGKRRAGRPSKKISPNWLRHAHALDHGALIHLVQATLGHSSVATTSAYVQAGPDSSALLSPETFLQKSDKPALHVRRTGVINRDGRNDSEKHQQNRDEKL